MVRITKAVMGVLLMAGVAQARTEKIVMSGEPVVGVAGAYDNFFQGPLLNNAGQIVFEADIIGQASLSGGWRYTPGVGVEAIMVRFMPMPSIGPDVLARSIIQPTLNDLGQSTWDGTFTGPGVVFNQNDRATWLGSPGTQALLAREGSAIPGGGVTHDAVFFTSIGDGGHAAVWSFVSPGGVTNDEVLIFGTPGNMEVIAREGSPLPGIAFNAFSIPSALSINASGAFAFAADWFEPPQNNVFKWGVWTGTSAATRDLVVRTGDDAPGGGQYETMAGVRINNNGKIGFVATLGDDGEIGGVYLGVKGDIQKVARTGDSADGGGTFRTFDLNVDQLNNADHVVFRALLNPGGGVNDANDSGIWVGSAGGPTKLIAREGQQAPGLAPGVTFDDQYLGVPVAFNDAGHVAFDTFVSGPGIDDDNSLVTYITDGIEAVKVFQSGDVFMGKTIATTFFIGGSTGDGSNTGLNNRGQIALSISFTDNTAGVFLWTPDLHWRATAGDGQWNSKTNWTLSIAPDAIYDVYIDPETDTVIDGPTDHVAVGKLSIGGGAGAVTLNLQPGGTITASSVTIADNGQVTGTGNLHGPVTSGGTLAPGNSPGTLNILDDLTLLETSHLLIEIGGTNPGVDSDFIEVFGDAVLDGVIDVSIINGLVLEENQSFHFMRIRGEVSGAFDVGPSGILLEAQGFGLYLTQQTTGSFTDLFITAVPEPATLTPFALGALALLRRRR